MAEAAEFIPVCVTEIAAYWRKRRPTPATGSSQPVSVSSRPISPAAMTHAHAAPGASLRSAVDACTEDRRDRHDVSSHLQANSTWAAL